MIRIISVLSMAVVTAVVLSFTACEVAGDGTGGSSGTSCTGDCTAPTPGNSGTMTSSTTAQHLDQQITVNWTAATDETSAQNTLQYRLYQSSSNNISTVAEIESNGTAVNSFETNITSKQTGVLGHGMSFYFNVIVKDEAGNKAAYTTKQQTTAPMPPPGP